MLLLDCIQCALMSDVNQRDKCILVFRKQIYRCIEKNILNKIHTDTDAIQQIHHRPNIINNIGLTIPGNWSFEIRRISPLISWVKSGGFHPDITVKSTQNYKSKCFSKNSSVWWMQGGGFHPEIWWISPMKSGWFHPDFTCEIHPKL